MKINIDATSNVIKSPEVRKQIEDNLRKEFENSIPSILEKLAKIPPLLTTDVGLYSTLLEEAKKCYKFGLYYSAVSMIGVAAERFSLEIWEKVEVKINENIINTKNIISNRASNSRLYLLKEGKLINDDVFNKLKEIKVIRDKYIHPEENLNLEKDSLRMLVLFTEILNSRFSEKFIIREGKIIDKSNSQVYSIKVD